MSEQHKQKMKEPISLRVSDSEDPQRGAKFKRVLDRKKASATDVLRALVDAYILSEGAIDFPVRLVGNGSDATPRAGQRRER